MSKDITILLVEDEVDIRSMLRQFLIKSGYHVIAAMNKEEALLWMGKKNFDFYLFDIMLPQEDGYDLATEVRKKQKLAPILFLTALHDIDHKLKAFDTDADDYLTKPFEFRELLARIASLLRRVDLSTATPNESIDLGELNLDLVSYNLTIGSGKYPLKPITGNVLQILMNHVNKVVPKYMILEYVWNEDTKRTHANLDVQIHYIRKILEGSRDFSIETVRGVGIKLASKPRISKPRETFTK